MRSYMKSHGGHRKAPAALRRLPAWLALLLSFTSPVTRALDSALDVNQLAHTAWTIREGFSRGSITSIAQTPDGYLWLGTEFGLLRFDGVRNVPWQPPTHESLPSSFVRRLLVSRDGALWIGTAEGLASWNGGRLCTIRGGRAICYGEDGSLGQSVEAIYQDRTGHLWVAAMTGLWRWDSGPPARHSMPEPVLSLTEDEDGSLLLAMRGGLSRFIDGRLAPYPLPAGTPTFSPTELFHDARGRLWIGTSDHGLVHLHGGRADIFGHSDGLSGDFVERIVADREGNIWVATLDGLDRFHDLAIHTISVKQGLSNATVESVLAAKDGSIWLGTVDGLNRWNHGQIAIYRERSAAASGLPDDFIESLFEDPQGQIWVSTQSGVAYLANGRFTSLIGVPGGVPSITGDAAGNIWISQRDHLFHVVGHRGRDHSLG